MNKKEYRRLYELESSYWWYIGRREIIKSLLAKISLNKNSHILEIGCGTGGNLEILSQFGEVTGLDNSPEAIEFCQKRGFRNCLLGDAENINFPERSFDLIAALDLLEHINDEQKVLKEIHRALKDDGYFLIMVPAYQFLWSEHDEALHHKRRYALPGLRDKLLKANFDIVSASYFIFFTALAFFIYRILRKIFSDGKKKENQKKTDYLLLPNFLNNFLISLLKLEAFLSKYITFPFGISIACIAKNSIPINDE